MQELTVDETQAVSGGVGIAGDWAGAVAGVAVGTAVGGARGGLIGGVAGFALGAAIGFGYSVATGGSKRKWRYKVH